MNKFTSPIILGTWHSTKRYTVIVQTCLKLWLTGSMTEQVLAPLTHKSTVIKELKCDIEDMEASKQVKGFREPSPVVLPLHS